MSQTLAATWANLGEGEAQEPASPERIIDIAIAPLIIIMLANQVGILPVRGERAAAIILDVSELLVALVALLWLAKRYREQLLRLASIPENKSIEDTLLFLIKARGIFVFFCYLLVGLGVLFPEPTKPVEAGPPIAPAPVPPVVALPAPPPSVKSPPPAKTPLVEAKPSASPSLQHRRASVAKRSQQAVQSTRPPENAPPVVSPVGAVPPMYAGVVAPPYPYVPRWNPSSSYPAPYPYPTPYSAPVTIYRGPMFAMAGTSGLSRGGFSAFRGGGFRRR